MHANNGCTSTCVYYKRGSRGEYTMSVLMISILRTFVITSVYNVLGWWRSKTKSFLTYCNPSFQDQKQTLQKTVFKKSFHAYLFGYLENGAFHAKHRLFKYLRFVYYSTIQILMANFWVISRHDLNEHKKRTSRVTIHFWSSFLQLWKMLGFWYYRRFVEKVTSFLLNVNTKSAPHTSKKTMQSLTMYFLPLSLKQINIKAFESTTIRESKVEQ